MHACMLMKGEIIDDQSKLEGEVLAVDEVV